MPLLSVIVPVYNVELYIEKCLESIVNQKFNDIEIIIVNDGSKDNSKYIIDKFEKQYSSKIKVYNKKNGGLGDARNFGLKKAKGKYVTFVDSDDWINLDIYYEAIKNANLNNSDIVIFDIVLEPKKLVRKNNLIEDKIYNINIDKELFLQDASVCNKIFKLSLFNDNMIEFPTNILHEDRLVMIKLLLNSKNITYINKVGYHYFQGRETSITKNINSKKYYDIIRVQNSIDQFMIKNNKKQNFKDELNIMKIDILVAFYCRALKEFKDKEFLKNYYDELININNLIYKRDVLNNKYYKNKKSSFKLKYNLIIRRKIILLKIILNFEYAIKKFLK
ncbi:glycosyltransferase family 2 protein [Clostridium perfringens]|uniref:glycosyltransferase family 2 protein n=1 Tax=Clostridium perfringens TaxID=1502 RepID=UPI0024BC96C5|nr:glycosyltransferase [Clostridium perfringens]